ncbi:protein FAR1-RELATED SEQUENCE 4-like [Cucumis melo var. makuwa]|uniref:Protein FAR1-RELATED SEQUENCE 4-like n=1 Tax=Cucumis melo var. makuwa TaxID=1194695 RepID=A0A5A7VEU2_CUCMM|nr:protein FAR1-RELATED SEQUENCE 4-like [Cucumis melo var. makuwa]
MITNKEHPGLYLSEYFEESYAMLSAFLDALIRNNPGIYTAEETNDEGWFKFYFMALAASIDAWNYCVPIIYVDGAAIKNKYLGTLVSACTIDGNSQIVPLAFAVVDSKNDFETLRSFLGNIMKWTHSINVPELTPLEFEYYMRQLEQLSPSMRHELEAVGRYR